jgi:tyrosine-specific transport protein
MSKNYFHAVATLVGTVIGVGMFAIPYVISRAGIALLFVYLPLIGFVQYYLHRLYAEIILSTRTNHRMPGYAEKYFGAKAKHLTSIAAVIGLHGAMLAYIIVGGIFLHKLSLHVFGTDWGLDVFTWTTALFVLESLIVLFGLKLIAGVELIMAGLLVLSVALIVWRGWGYIDVGNYTLIDWRLIFLPYGPIFFAVGGNTAIPAVCRLLKHKEDNIKSAIFWGSFIPLAVVLVFAAVIVGITGVNTSPDALVGLSSVLGDGVVTFALIFGLLSVITSFLVIAQALKEIYWWDFKINKKLAWALACGIPYALYLAGLHNLTKVVGLSGAIVGGMIGIILIALILKVKEGAERASVIKNKINKPIAYGLSLLFLLGLVYQIWEVFFNSF